MEINILSAREAVRARPDMYIGSTDARGIHQLCWELVGNAFDQYLQGQATSIEIKVAGAWLEVRDDGPGIKAYSKQGTPMLPEYLTALHASGRAPAGLPQVRLADNFRGCGLACVFLLSSRFFCETIWQGHRYVIEGLNGRISRALENLGPDPGRGTTIRFIPDPAVFADATLCLDRLYERLIQILAFNPELTVCLQGKQVAHHEGAGGLLARALGGRPMLNPAFQFKACHEGVCVALALQWGAVPEAGVTAVQSFINFTPLDDPSKHLRCVLAVLRQAWTDVFEQHGFCDSPMDQVGKGLWLRSHLTVLNPMLGPPGRRFENPLLCEAIQQTTTPAFKSWINRLSSKELKTFGYYFELKSKAEDD